MEKSYQTLNYSTEIIEETEEEVADYFSKKTRVGIIGGTFNPVHNGHLLIADQVYDKLNLDEVWFMPNASPPHKQISNKVKISDCLEMLRRALRSNVDFCIETIETEASSPNYTYETMEILTTLYPNIEFYFIIGADMVEDLPNWYKIDDLLDLVTFVGVKRQGYELETPYPIIVLDIIGTDISSTVIRKQVKAGASIRYLVPESVEDYIKEMGLYLD